MPTLTNAQLHALIKPILPFASKDTTLPILASIRLEPVGDKLAAIATDRYRVGRMRLTDVEAEGFQATLPVTAVKWLLGVFKAKDATNEVVLTPKDSQTITVKGRTQLGPVLSTDIYMVGGDYPNLSGLFPEDLEKYEHAASAGVNGSYLADMGAVTGTGYNAAPLEIRLTERNQQKAIVFTHEAGPMEFTGLLMPVRMPSASK
jgi:hypothetical protein